MPYLYYDDPRAALEHLCRVFGFEQTMLLEWPDGSLAHAEASLHGERAYAARDPEGNLWTFREHRRDPTHEELTAALAAISRQG